MATNAIGRPSGYSPEIADSICDRLKQGESLRAICQSEDFPSRQTVFNWLEEFPAFFDQYSRARDIGLDCRAERILEIPRGVRPEDVPRARLEFDAERWYLSKLAPKRYGDAMQLRHADADGNKMTVEVTRVAPRAQRVIDVTPTPARRLAPAPGDQAGVAGGTASEGAD